MPDPTNGAQPSQPTPELQNQPSPEVDEFSVFEQELGAAPTQGGQQEPQPKPFEVDPRFKDLPEGEAIVRTLQSRYDKATAENNKLQTVAQQNQRAAELLNALMSDPNMLRGFVNQVNPELIPKSDPEETARAALRKEFGEDFEPDRDEAMRDPFGKSAKYYRRAEELLKSAEGSVQDKTLEELIKERKQREQEESAQLTCQWEEVKQKRGVDDQFLQETLAWADKLTLDQLVLMRSWQIQRLRNSGRSKANLGGVPPMNTMTGGTQVEELVGKLFGPPQSKVM